MVITPLSLLIPTSKYLHHQLMRRPDHARSRRRIESRHGGCVYLPVSEDTSQVKDLVSVVTNETLGFRAVDESKEADVGSSLKANTESCFNGLQATSHRVHEVVEGVVAIYVHLAG